MSHPPISPLAENAGFVFAGEPAWAPAGLTRRQAGILSSASNASGRPNSDVLGMFIRHDGRGLVERWQVDFPAYYTQQEAALYARPFAHLQKQNGSASAAWWVNPQANDGLRRALARADRFLVTPIAAARPAWSWVQAGRLPDASLLVFARDDDFTHAVLSSRFFEVWWTAHHSPDRPVPAAAAFPFPWAPERSLGSLNSVQQNQRQEAARAARSGDRKHVDSVVAAAYGWPAEVDESDLVSKLEGLHSERNI